MTLLASILLPATDAGVVVQLAVVVTVAAACLWLARGSKEITLFVVGLLVMTLALFGLRAIH